MELATGTHVIGLLSADLETEPEAIPRMVRKLRETGCDAVTGNRWLPGGGFVGYDRLKLALNWIFQKSFSLLYLTRIGDLSYGYKLLSKEICESIEWEGTLHEIFIETTVKPLKAGYHIEQVPTVWTARSEGASKNTFWRNFRYVSMALRSGGAADPPAHRRIGVTRPCSSMTSGGGGAISSSGISSSSSSRSPGKTS